MTAKRSRKVLPIEDKIRIINRLEEGESVTALSKIYNVGKATISDIKGKKIEILKFASKLSCFDGVKKRKIMKKPNDETLDEAVYLWYRQMKNLGEFVSGHLLRSKALELNGKLGGSSEFKASSGWLTNFKVRHGIKLSLSGSLPPDETVWLSDIPKGPLNDGEDILDLDERIEAVDFKLNVYDKKREYLPSHAEAFIALETAMAWCEQQSECNIKDLIILKKMKDLAEQKIHSALTQRKDEVCMVLG